MTLRDAQQLSDDIRSSAGREYIRRRNEQTERIDRRETDDEIRRAIAALGNGNWEDNQ